MHIEDFFRNKRKNDVYIIAEISQNHDGSLGQAHAFIDACAETGIDAIKFQTHIAEAESTLEEPFRVKFSYEDKTRYEYWKRMEFSEEQWIGLKEHAEGCGLDFLSSPFSIEAFQLLEKIGTKAWKVGSGEVFNSYLLDLMIKTGKPILLSTGMSTFKDIDEQVMKVRKGDNDFAVFQCTTAYPNSYDRVGLNVIDELKEKYHCMVGLSDHSGKIYPALAAVARGARVIEAHVTFSEYMFGPDVSSSLTIEQLKELTEGIRAITCMMDNPVNKLELAEEYASLKSIFAKGLYAQRDIQQGEIICMQDVSMKKPLIGMPAEKYEEIIGKKINIDLKKGQPIYEHFFDV